jgi:hypothetical protein
MKRTIKPTFVLAFVLTLSANLVWGQDVSFEDSHSIDWIRGEMYSQASFNLADAGIRLPTGRFLGEDILREAFPGLLRPFLLSIRFDSNSTIRDIMERGEVSMEELDTLCLEAKKVPPSLSADLTRMTSRYTIFLQKIGALLSRHRRTLEPAKPLIPAPTTDYTGIIIIADKELPIHGRRTQAMLEPCLFPKIWDTDMTLVYERNMFAPEIKEERLMARYTIPESIFRPTPSGLEGDLASLLGSNPLRILAREVFGVSPTDPVIDRDDALKILSSENNRRLLREGRVLLVLSETRLIPGDR